MTVPTATYLFWKHLQAEQFADARVYSHLHDAPEQLRKIAARKPIRLASGVIVSSAPHWTARVNTWLLRTRRVLIGLLTVLLVCSSTHAQIPEAAAVHATFAANKPIRECDAQGWPDTKQCSFQARAAMLALRDISRISVQLKKEKK